MALTSTLLLLLLFCCFFHSVLRSSILMLFSWILGVRALTHVGQINNSPNISPISPLAWAVLPPFAQPPLTLILSPSCSLSADTESVLVFLLRSLCMFLCYCRDEKKPNKKEIKWYKASPHILSLSRLPSTSMPLEIRLWAERNLRVVCFLSFSLFDSFSLSHAFVLRHGPRHLIRQHTTASKRERGSDVNWRFQNISKFDLSKMP